MKDIDIIKKFYENKVDQRPLYNFSKLDIEYITTNNNGLGDNMLLTCIGKQTQRKIYSYSNSRHWNSICKFNSYLENYLFPNKSYFLTEHFGDLGSGNGHIIQGIQRGLNLPVEVKPKGYLYVNENILKNNKIKIALCFSTNNSGNFLINMGYKNPRNLNENSIFIINEFINKSNYDFIQIGDKDILKNNKVKNKINISVEETILELNNCDFYIGLNSGFMHVAAALDIKSIILVNVPHVKDFYLPILKNVPVYDLGWLYPQNVHLHEYGENEIVKNITIDNIKKSIDGNIFPYWKFEHLDLVNK